MKGMGAVVICSVLAAAAAGVHAGVISDATFFSSLDYTRIDFETYSAGGPVVVDPHNAHQADLFYDEYTGMGVTFDRDLYYVDDQDPSFDAAQSIGGSMLIAIPGAAYDNFVMIFEVPVRSFGFWVVNNNTKVIGVTFTAKNSSGTVLDTVSLTGSLIDGTVGIADYGFMGIWADQNIARVEVSKDAAILDNLTFSDEVPEPASLVLLAAGSLAVLRRRRR